MQTLPVIVLPLPPILQGGGLKILKHSWKGWGRYFFIFLGGTEPQGGMVFSRGDLRISTRKFKPMIKYFILWGQDNKIFSLLTLVKFSSNSLTFLSLYLKWQCFKSCPHLLAFKSHAFCTLWVWQTGVFGVKNMLYLRNTWAGF